MTGVNSRTGAAFEDGEMATHDLYTFVETNLEKVRLAVEQALGLKLELHDSLYFGEYYRYEDVSGEILRLTWNKDPLEENDRLEPTLPDTTVLLYVENTKRARDLEIRLRSEMGDIILLRREKV